VRNNLHRVNIPKGMSLLDSLVSRIIISNLSLVQFLTSVRKFVTVLKH